MINLKSVVVLYLMHCNGTYSSTISVTALRLRGVLISVIIFVHL